MRQDFRIDGPTKVVAVVDRRAGVIAGTLAMAFVGSSAAVSPLLTAYPVLTGQTWRYAVAAALLLAFVALRRLAFVALPWRGWVRLAVLAGTGLAGFNVCLLEAARYTDPPVLGAVVGAAPLVLAITGPMLERRRPSLIVAASAAVVLAGVVIVLGGGGFSLPGLLWSLGALAGECLFSLLAVSLMPVLGPVRLSAYACALATPMLAVAALVIDREQIATLPTRSEALALGYLATIVTALAFALWYASVGSLGVDRAGLLTGIVPVAATLIAVAIGTAALSTQALLGSVLVGLGVSIGLIRSSEPAASLPGAGRVGRGRPRETTVSGG